MKAEFGGVPLKAIVYTEYGPPDVLQVREVDVPTPRQNELLVRVRAASVNAYDWRMLKADPFLVRLMGGGFLRPKQTILGADVAGRVEAVGENVTQYQPGDEVFGCARGGFAEYVCARESAFALNSGSMTFEVAAAVPMAGLTALQGLRDRGQIQPGQKVLVNGASGGVGTFAVQIAKSFGTEVTAVCSTGNLDMARAIGADHVIDYTQEDFTRSGRRYDLIFAANGHHSIFDYTRALTPRGVYVVAGGTMAQMFQAMLIGPWISKTGGKKVRSFVAGMNHEDLVVMSELIEAGRVKPVIERRYPLSEAAEALRYVGEGHAKGKIVITVDDK